MTHSYPEVGCHLNRFAEWSFLQIVMYGCLHLVTINVVSSSRDYLNDASLLVLSVLGAVVEGSFPCQVG